MNRKEIDADTIEFEDFVNSSQANAIGDSIEVPMAGPYTAKRFVISAKARHLTDSNKVVITARAFISHAGRELNPVTGTVKHCGSVVAHYIHDEACGLHYVGKNLEQSSAPYFCAETALEALRQFAA
jgi:hypothetical protein